MKAKVILEVTVDVEVPKELDRFFNKGKADDNAFTDKLVEIATQSIDKASYIFPENVYIE